MFELVPSETMRQIFKEDGFEFSDFQKATLIWNAPNTTRQERLEALTHLADKTEDMVTKIQIQGKRLIVGTVIKSAARLSGTV